IVSISVKVPVTPEVGAAIVASPTRVLELDTHSSSEADPSESSPPLVSVAPMVSPFLCLDDSESDTKIPTAPILPAPSAIVTPSSEFPLAPVVAPPGIHQRRAILIRPGEDIPIGRLYRTHLGGPCRALTARKSVRPLPSHRLALRYTSHHLDHFTSGSSSHSSSYHSSSGHSILGHSLSGHTPPDTTDRSAPLSTPYPPTTSESSLGSSSERSLDSSTPSYRLSRKRCRSPAASVPSPTHDSRSIAPTPADLLPPRKRFRDSYSSDDSGKEHMEVDTIDAKAVVDVGISDGVVAHTKDSVGMRVETTASDVREDDEEFKVEASTTDMREVVVDPLA
ncbi:hypothetical protein Tco_0062234, partial [Tanacetum coccineum]